VSILRAWTEEAHVEQGLDEPHGQRCAGCQRQLKYPQIWSLENSPVRGVVDVLGRGRACAAEGVARSRTCPTADPADGQAASLVVFLAAITRAFFLSLSR
jgi:hypothetical protein